MYEELFNRFDETLQKLAFVFARQTNFRIDKEDLYQDFAVRLIELRDRYREKPLDEFAKIVNRSMRGLAIDHMNSRGRIVPVDEEKIGPIFTIEIEKSFLYYYREAARSILKKAKSAEILEWLVDNVDSVYDVRRKRNKDLVRTLNIGMRDVIEAIMANFDMNRNAATQHFREIRRGLQVVMHEAMVY